jgi:GNAT superfamily N-acetyltransferase
MNDASEGEGVLNAVAPAAQGRGLYRALLLEALRWCEGRGATRMVISTQLTNLGVQRVWCLLGFVPSHAFYTFHCWFAPAAGAGER